MNKKFFTTTILFLSLFFSQAQSITENDLKGCWSLESVKSKDGTLMNADDEGKTITCFELGGKFSTKEIIDGEEHFLGTGGFKILSDGKTIVQNRGVDDDEIDADMIVNYFDKNKLLFESRNIVMEYKRVE